MNFDPRALLLRSRTTPSSAKSQSATGTYPMGSAHHQTRVQRSVDCTHQCHTPYIVPRPSQSILESGPVPYASYDSVTFIAEQVSHHPPSEHSHSTLSHPHTPSLSHTLTLPHSLTPSHSLTLSHHPPSEHSHSITVSHPHSLTPPSE